MRIISDFKDYYDGLQALDQDKETLFLRKSGEEYFIPPKGFPSMGNLSFIVGFAGTLYPCVEVLEKKATRVWIKLQKRWEEVPEKYKYYYDHISLREKAYPKFRFCNDVRSFPEWIDSIKSWGERLTKQFCPIFILYPKDYGSGWLVKISPRLADYGFASVLPPTQAYQELTRWRYSQVEPAKPIPEISDETRAELHGYNKYSFRKDKST